MAATGPARTASPAPSQVTAKTAATVTLTVLGILAGGWILWRTSLALLVTSAGFLAAVALNMVVGWLEGRGIRRGVGIALAMLALLGVLVALGFLLVPPAVAQIGQLVREWPALLQQAERSPAYRFLERQIDLSALVQRVGGEVPSLLGHVVDVLRWVAAAVGGVVTVLFVTLFMLVSGPRLVRGAIAQARPENRAYWSELVRKIDRALGGYVIGHAVIVTIQGTATTLLLFALRVPWFLPLGVLGALASLIPFAGVVTGGALLSLVAWGTRGLWSGVSVAAYFLVYQQFESHVLYPVVYRHTVQLNPLVLILAALFMADLAGVAGALLAVPLAAAGHIVLVEALRARRERLRIPGPSAESASAPDRAANAARPGEERRPDTLHH